MIITPISEEDDATLQLLRQFEQDGIPVVLIDRDVREHQFDGVFSNDIEGACEAVECLIQEGHERIGVITGPSTSKPGNDRCIGYRRALEVNMGSRSMKVTL